MEEMKMSPSSWKNSLTRILAPQTAEPPRVAVVGIGNEFNGDDAAGVWVTRKMGTLEFSADAGHVLVIEAGQAPENITADLRCFQPQVVLLIDAAQMDNAPGSIAWIPWESTTGMSASSHSLPLSMLARYLTLEFGCSVHLLGIQPAWNEAHKGLSPAARSAVDEICMTLCQSLFEGHPSQRTFETVP